MLRRFLPAALVLAAFLSDLANMHGAALALLLCAIPAAFVVALDWYGDCLEGRCGLLRPILGALSLAVLVLSAALRSPAVVGGLPAFAVSALVLVLLLYATVGVGALLPAARTVPESA
jgi:hypothetical protein